MTFPLTTLDLVKQYVAVNQKSDGSLFSGRDDQTINDAITAYSDVVNDFLQWYVGPQTITDKIYRRIMSMGSKVHMTSEGTLVIRTDYPTIRSVSAIAYKQVWTAAWIPIDPQFVELETLDPDTRPTQTSYQIRLAPQSGPWQSWRSWPQVFFVQVTMDVGYATIPPPIGRAATEWVGYDYRLRAFIPTMAAGFIGMPMTVIKPLRVPPHIEQILWPWARKSQ